MAMVAFFFQAEDGIRDGRVTGVQTCALPISFRSVTVAERIGDLYVVKSGLKPGERVIVEGVQKVRPGMQVKPVTRSAADRKSTRLNSSHPSISYAVFCLKKKKKKHDNT